MTSILFSLGLFAASVGISLGIVLPVLAQESRSLSVEQETALKEAERLDQQVVQLYQQGKFSEAIPLAEQSLAIRKSILGENHLDVAGSLNNLAELYENQGRYSEAEPLLKQTLELFRRILGENHPNVALSLNNLAELYYSQGRYSEAEPLFKQALELRKRTLAENHPDVALSLNNLAELYENQGRYSEAEPLLKQTLELFRRILGENHPNVALSLNNLAELYYSQGRYSEAEPLFKQALDLRKRTLAENHPLVASSLNSLAELYRRQGRYSEAEPLLKQALELRKRTLGENHPDVASSLNNLAELYKNQGRYSEAEPLLKQALELRKRTLGENHPDVASSLNNLAELYENQGRYSKAEPLLKQALELYRRLLGKNHPDVAGSLNNLAELYENQGRYSEAEPLLKQALELFKRTLGENHSLVATSLSNLAALYYRQGRYSEAEPLLKQALELRKRTLGENHPDVASSLNNLAELYENQGRYSEAEPLLKQTLELFKRTLGENHPNVATSLSNLAAVYYRQGRYSEAEPLLKQTLELFKRTLGENHPDVASSLNNLAELYENQGRYSEAEPLLKQTLELFRRILGENHPNVALSLNNLAELYYSQGRYSEAEPLFKQALELRKRTLAENHPDVALSLNNLAELYKNQGDSARAIALLTQGLQIEERNLDINLAIGAETQKRSYLATIAATTDAAISLHLQSAPNNPNAARLAITTLLRRKGRILDALTNGTQRLRQNLTPADQKRLDELTTVRTQLATLFYGGLGKLSPEQYKDRITQLQQQSTQLEADLNNRSAEFRTDTQPITLEAIQAQIPANTALVELIRYHPFNPKAKGSDRWGKSHYAAYILSPQGEIKSIDLGEAAAIDQLAAQFRRLLQDPYNDPKPIARHLDALLMQPIRQKLSNTRKLLISPDSQLNLIPFAALVDEQNRYLVETHAISYLTTGRDLLRLQDKASSRQAPVIIANPDYDHPGNSAPVIAQNSGVPSNQRSLDLASLKVTPLPGTDEEAKAIASKLPKATLLTGTQASENALKQVQAPSILHIATHGFFLEDLSLPALSSRSLSGSRPIAIPIFPDKSSHSSSGNTENALLRSGLALAGFNPRQSGNDDGVLTALEAANLNLRGTQLVVLSACETGLGDIANGEGVYGLRRAFTLAGAETEMMSLWKVNDNGTKDLMVQYYDKLLKGIGRGDALLQTQRTLLNNPQYRQYRHPYYWASFILSGNWQPLR